nr:MAG TPA: hypothetical protein [Bacteriophage sp.]
MCVHRLSRKRVLLHLVVGKREELTLWIQST